MKNFIPLILLFTAFAGFSQPKKIMLQTEGIEVGSVNDVKFYANTPKSYRLSISIEELEWDKHQAKNGETYTKLWFKNSLPDGNIGEPELPVVKKLIRIPLGATVSARVSKYSMKDVQLLEKGIQNPIIPVQPPARKDQDTLQLPFHIKPQAYLKSSFQTTIPDVTVEVLGNLRDYTIARITVHPLEYSPANQKLRVFSKIDVDIEIVNTKTASETNTNPYYSPYFDVVYKSMLNAGGVAYDEHPDLTRYPVGMLIIAHRMFEAALQPFIAWKTQKGFTVTTKYTDEIGTTADAIKSYIQTVYQSVTPENPAPTFLVIVGDVEQVPASATGTQSGKLTDLYYASVDGDMFPDMYYGRLSAISEAQLTAMVNKILYYEKFQFADAQYLNNATLIAGADATWNPAIAQPTIKYATANHFNQTKGWNSIYEYGVASDTNNPLVTPGYTGCYDPQRIAVGFINYTAHCNETNWQDPALNITTVNAFTNNQQYPFVVANCCLSGNFGYYESVGEAWIRKSNGGAVTYIGSSPNSYWKEDMYWAVGAFPMSGDNNGYVPSFDESTTGGYDAPFISDYVTAGAIMFCGNLAVTQAEFNDYPRDVNSTYYWEAYNVLGDPSLIPYFKVPEINQITFPDSVAVGINSIPTGAKARTFVSLTKNGQIIGTMYYPTDSIMDIPIPALTDTGKIVLTATRPLTQPFIDTIDVSVADSAYITLSSITIDDTAGNNNAVPDYGETVKVNLLVKNVGKTGATSIGAKITASQGLITLITTDSIGIGNMDAETEKWINAAFTFSIPTDIDDKYSQVFPITFTSPQGFWTSNLKITASAPRIVYNGFTVIDTLMGNSNGFVDRTEVVDLVLEFQNLGSSSIPDFSAHITIPDTLLNEVAANFEPISNRTLLPNEKTILTLRLSTSPQLTYDTIPITVNLNSLSYPKATQQKNVSIPVALFEVTKMLTGTVNTCSTLFTDSGGENADYSNNESHTLTFEALNDIQKYHVEFLAFSTESGYDYLYAFDGPSVNSNAIAGSPYNGNILPASFYTRGESVTFRFTSDESQTTSGWKAKIECYTPQQLPTCPENPQPANNDSIVEYSILSWDASPDALFYDVYIGTHPDSLAYFKRVTESKINIALSPQTTYYWRVIPGNQFGLCDKSCEIWNFRTASLVGQVLMDNATVDVDSIWFYDSGGPNASYGDYEDKTITFKPRAIGKRVKVEFILFDVESHTNCEYDRLLVFNGPSTQSTSLGTYCGSTIQPSFTSTSVNGELTFRFISDENTVNAGWKAKVTTVGSANEYPLTVRVMNNDNPVPNASVSINNGIKISTATGTVTYNLPDGSYSYAVNALGFEPKTGTTNINGTGKTIDVELAKQDTVLLLVRSAYNHVALPLSKIVVNSKTSYTADDGTATIHIPAGSYTFSISADGYNPKDTLITIPGGISNHVVNLTPVFYNIQLLVNNIAGSKISDAQVTIDGLTGQTNINGLASFSLPKGVKKVLVQKDGFINTEFWLNVCSDSTYSIYLNQILGSVYSVKFTVNGSGPKGTWLLNNALVKIYSGTELYQQGKTNYGIANLYLPSGTYSYEVECEGFISTSRTDFSVNNSSTTLNVTLNQITNSITFNVQSKGNPVANALVKVDGYPEQQTDANGSTTFGQIGYEVGLPYSVSHPDYYTFSGSIDATKSEIISVNLTPTATEIVNPDTSVSVFPNPATNYFTVNASDTIESISIISINGVLLYETKINASKQTINLNLQSGMYLVRLKMDNGKVHLKKLIIR